MLGFAWSATRLRADDPLIAFPTAERPAEQRVQELTENEREAIRLPADPDQVVFTLTENHFDGAEAEGADVKPWIRVFADGRTDCGHLLPFVTERREDRLTSAELSWLLHLAVNECRMLSRTTQEVAEEYERWTGPSPSEARKLLDARRPFQYYVNLPAGENEIAVPQFVLVGRPLRARMKFDAFASLHKYVNFLTSRAFLGTDAEREAILAALNAKLAVEAAESPPFLIEHLISASSVTTPQPGFKQTHVGAAFQQEISLGDNRFRRVLGTVHVEEAGDAPTINIQVSEYRKG